MKRILTMALVMLVMSASIAYADFARVQQRRQADSGYRIAVKMYNNAVAQYGESLKGMPQEERDKACRQLSSALYDNRWQRDQEDIFTVKRYDRQIRKLESQSKAYGCTK